MSHKTHWTNRSHVSWEPIGLQHRT